jgi:outer membrane protein TolC
MLAGCTMSPTDEGFSVIADAASKRLGKQAIWVRTDKDRQAVAQRTHELLLRPLSSDDAVQVALLNNPGLQATYADLGIAQADLAQASRLPNPGFRFSRTHSSSDLSIERTFSLGLLSALTMPAVMRIKGARVEQTKLVLADAMLAVAADTRRAYIEAVAARQSLQYAQQVVDSAQAGAELARRLREAGNQSKLDYARQQASYAQAAAMLAKAQLQVSTAREKLTRVMGLWGDAIDYALPDRLPALPAERAALVDLEQWAVDQRLDVQAARLQARSVATSLGLTRATRMINVLSFGYVDNNETDKGHEHGYEISIEVPLFDWGGAKVARAEATYRQAVERLAQVALQARSQVRQSYAAYVTSYDVARHYRDEVLPVRKAISNEMLLRYNGMLASVFDLLADARDQADAVSASIDALKDFWLAETDLERALGGRLPTVAQHTGAVVAAVSVPAASQPTTRGPAAAHEQQEH